MSYQDSRIAHQPRPAAVGAAEWGITAPSASALRAIAGTPPSKGGESGHSIPKIPRLLKAGCLRWPAGPERTARLSPIPMVLLMMLTAGLLQAQDVAPVNPERMVTGTV